MKPEVRKPLVLIKNEDGEVVELNFAIDKRSKNIPILTSVSIKESMMVRPFKRVLLKMVVKNIIYY